MITRALALVRAWLIIDFFGDSRSSGHEGSTLTTAIFGQSSLGLLLAAVLFPDQLDGSRLVPYAAANLSLSSLLMGISVLGQPTQPLRLRADEVLVRTAPVGRGLLALARLLHGGFSLSLITIGIALPAAILSYWVAGQASLVIVPAYLAVACVLAGIVAGGLAVVSALAARWLGVARGQLLGATLRAALLAGGFIGFAVSMPHLGGTADDLPLGRGMALAWPPYWGARWLAAPVQAVLFGAAVLGLAGLLFGLSVVAQRAPSRVAARGVRRPGWLARLDGRFAGGGGPLLGLTSFISTMLYRSPGYRAKVLPILGLPAAMIGLALWTADPEHRFILLGITLQFPAIYLPILVAFLVQADEPGSSWVFATSETGCEVSPRVRQAALISLTTHVLLPAHAVALVVLALSDLGVVPVLALSSFSLGTAILVAVFAVRQLDAVPFTVDGDAVPLDAGGLMGVGFVMGIVGALFAAFAANIWGLVFGIGVLALALRPLRGGGRPVAEPRREPSLGRELLAVLFLYAVLAVIPILIGVTCSGP